MQIPVCLLFIIQYSKSKTMTLLQISKNRMYKNVLGFLTANRAAFAAFARLVSQAAVFGKENTVLDGFIDQQAGSSKGYTGDKNSILAALIANLMLAQV